MKKSPLFLLVSSLSPIEIREAGKFLRSPFFNTRKDLVVLFDYLSKQEEPTKEEAWSVVVGKKDPFDDQKCRLLWSYLHKLLEQFVVTKETQKEELENRLRLARSYRKRGLAKASAKGNRALEQALRKQELRDANYLKVNYEFLLEQNIAATSKDPASTAFRHEMEKTLDAYYLSIRLRLICLSIAQRGVYQTGKDLAIDQRIITFAEQKEWETVPAVATYLYCFRMLSQPEDESHFQRFKNYLLQLIGQFAADEMRGFYLMAINYCIRRLNEGATRFLKEIFDLYRSGIESGYLLEDGTLSLFTYHNVVAVGLKTGELDWVNQFIYGQKNALERRYRESAFSFNLARLEYTRRNFGLVLELLQKANYRDPLVNLAAKTLLLKTYYELAEYDLLQSHLDAMRNYVRRKRVIGYHQRNILNIVRFTEKLMGADVLGKSNRLKLRAAIEQEEELTEKEWLLASLGQ